ncbi:NAD(P)/FAD-dependent oxidoreductase [Salinibacterium sp. SYSU T00001]|uniref:NAD(P)/FAD-dependent oxidoreductase n=1 Tax=Homoserinimonas sedimenticola TaxID=2986805 RepID=UPI0022367BE0|nr:NAD(P)/FAD-dependent oxidoreductase [Salinibacterium sedimenticola]MCW4384205.1 NAD(P)/FAD-dependent oxidoreductase [Salinibacterium sedimenticola]
MGTGDSTEHTAASREGSGDTSTDVWDAVIIGGGPAGLSAALMLGRARRRVLVVDAGEPRNRFTSHVHGVLGSEGTPPIEFLARGREEVRSYGVEIRRGQVTAVTEGSERMLVATASGESFAARRVIATSGSRDGLPDIPGAGDRWGKDVLHCPYCHGWEVRGGRLGVLATSSASIHQAHLVRQWSEHVTFFSAEAGEVPEDVAARLGARGVVIDPRPVTRLATDAEGLSGAEVEGGDVVPLDALFVTPILKSNEEFLEPLELEREGSVGGDFVRVDKTGRTSNPRVWAVGNVARPIETVPMVVAAGASAGAAVNQDLIDEEFDAALAAEATIRLPS